jgi:hypothetical protein
MPVAPAAFSVWQVLQPAVANTWAPSAAPPLDGVDEDELELLPPQPTTTAEDMAMATSFERTTNGLYRRDVSVYAVASMRSPRALLVMLGLAALLIAIVQGVSGVSELAFYAGPFLLVLGLLLSGRFIGEDAILARRAPKPARRLRPARRRWAAERERAFASLLERSPRLLRGPPVSGLA